MKARAVSRIRVITAGVLLLALVLVVRLYHIQILHADTYAEAATKQYTHTVRDLFNRGSIYFTTRDGEEVSAATIKTGYLLTINPGLVDNPAELYTTLNDIVPLEREPFMAAVNDTDRSYYEAARSVTQEQGTAIEELDVDGVSLYRDQWRYYPADTLAAQTLGFVAYDGDTLAGRYGLERYYDDLLTRDRDSFSVNFFAEIFTNLQNAVFDGETDTEGDLVTSIEPTVARTLQAELQKVHKTWKSKETGGIIINPQTGDIYALGVAPSFNLNDRSGVGIDEFKNPLVENVYEMGSIIKPLTMAAGIDAGAVTPESTYYDAGHVELDGQTIRNYDGRGRGRVDMQEVLSQSLNTGVTFIVQTMGTDRFREYFKNLELGSETGIDLPSEAHGLIGNLDSPRTVEYATASFGQGIALTPIETVRALATLANNGRLVTPHIGQEKRYVNGAQRAVAFPDGDAVYKKETTEAVTRMLVEVVDTALAHGEEKIDHYTVAAKTGTAQIANPNGGGYYDDRYLHSFFGYFPAYDPQFLVFLYTVEPEGVRYASQTLTDPFMHLTHFLINYYNIPPDR